MIIRVYVTKTHHDARGLERVARNHYVVDEAEARELAAAGVLAPVLEALLPAEASAVASLSDELFAVEEDDAGDDAAEPDDEEEEGP